MEKTFRADDPTGHLEAAWAIKERFRILLPRCIAPSSMRTMELRPTMAD